MHVIREDRRTRMAKQKSDDSPNKAIDYQRKLPDTEFELMHAIWHADTKITTNYLMEKVGNPHNWKSPTLISFLVRLEDKGYISSVKEGKERVYSAVADEQLYMYSATYQFLDLYHNGSFISLLDTIFLAQPPTMSEVDSILNWLKQKLQSDG